MSNNNDMHPRNPYKDKPPDFKTLAMEYPEFRQYSVRCLTQTLLKKDFKLEVELPAGHLVPRVPQKLNYCLLIDDLLRENGLSGGNVLGIDIGTGTSCIHALLGARHFGWKFVATDADPVSVRTAHANVAHNGLGSEICVVHVNPAAKCILMDVLMLGEFSGNVFDFCMCNPPFFDAKNDEKFREISENSYSNDMRDGMDARGAPHSATHASAAELYVEGGEVAFVNRIIDDSVVLRERVRIYTTMLGRKQSVKPLCQRLQRFGDDVKFMVSPLNQGKTKRWMLAWTFSKSIALTALMQERAIEIQCPKPGRTRILQQIEALNGKTRQQSAEMLVVEFRSVTWTHQRARRRAEAELHKNEAKRAKLNTRSIGCEALFGVGDGRDSYTDSGNFTSSESLASGEDVRDNATQTYHPMPPGVTPRYILRVKIYINCEEPQDLLTFELISGSKQSMCQLVQYLRNSLCR
ncbi:unnamed protein product [Caenorhabditis sp. 36 PRJEB53466]|nr:unnamed protein product [Caenorhabditis sp. 36 PRJEB53466]